MSFLFVFLKFAFSLISKKHVKDRRTLCKLCFLNSQALPLEMTLFNIDGEDEQLTYANHLRNGSMEFGDVFIRHYRCTLCFGQLAVKDEPNVDHYFFDNDALFKHAAENHVICIRCTEKYTFFRDVEALKEHFANEH